MPQLLLILTLVFGLPRSHEATIVVDRIELNHYYCDGELKYTQIIIWEWLPDYRRFRVRQWKIVEHETEYPSKQAGGWVVADLGDDLRVRTKLYQETWTLTDPEREDRRLSPDWCRIPVDKK